MTDGGPNLAMVLFNRYPDTYVYDVAFIDGHYNSGSLVSGNFRNACGILMEIRNKPTQRRRFHERESDERLVYH